MPQQYPGEDVLLLVWLVGLQDVATRVAVGFGVAALPIPLSFKRQRDGRVVCQGLKHTGLGKGSDVHSNSLCERL